MSERALYDCEIDGYEGIDESPANLDWMERVRAEVARKRELEKKQQAACSQPFKIELMDCIKDEKLAALSHPSPCLQAITEIEAQYAEEDDEACFSEAMKPLWAACRFLIANGKSIPITWGVHFYANDMIRMLKVLLKNRAKKKPFNAVQPALFDD